MPDLTPKLGLKKPVGSEAGDLKVFVGENMQLIDDQTVTQTELDAHQGAAVLDHADGSVTDAKIGDRTPDQAVVPATPGTGKLGQILSWFANSIKVSKGTANWWDAPAASIATLWDKFNQTTGHTHTGAANDGPQIPIGGIAAAAKTSAGGTEPSRLMVSNVSGRGGDSEKLGGVAAANFSRKDLAETRTGDLTMGAGTKLTLAADPGTPLEAVTKQYADALKAGLAQKQPVRVATIANIGLNGLQTIDGVVLVAGDRVLVWKQTTATQNGIYVAAAGAWSRATDADANAEVRAGLTVLVNEGNTWRDYNFSLMTDDPISVDVTALTFGEFSRVEQIVPEAGLYRTGTRMGISDGGVTDTQLGNRTVDQALAAPANTGPLTSLLSWIVGGIKAEKGTVNWYDAAPTTLTAAKAHMDAAAPHSGHETPAGAQAKADAAAEESLVVESVAAVTGAEATNVQTSMGPAVEFAGGVTQGVTWNRVFPFGTNACKIELRYAADVANAGSFRIRVARQVNGGAATNVDVTVTPGNDVLLHTADLGIIVPDASVSAGDMITFTLSRLGADVADTHTGKLRIYQTRLKRG